MTTESAPSFRTEAFNLAVAELAQFPDAHAAVLKKLEVGIQAIKAQPKSSGNSNALKGYQEAYAAFGKGRRMGSALVHLPPPPPVPKTMKDEILALAAPTPRAIATARLRSTVSTPSMTGEQRAGALDSVQEAIREELDFNAISALADDPAVREANEKSKRLRQSVTNLANKLGEILEGVAKDNADDFFSVKPGEDPFTKLDAGPRLVHTLDLVPDGEGEDFTPERMIVIVPSYNVYLDGVFVKRDYRINGSPAIQTHPDIVRVDSNLKIRSTKKKIGGQEYAFYAKAFWVKNGDSLYGYLNINQGREDVEKFAKHFRVAGGKLVPR